MVDPPGLVGALEPDEPVFVPLFCVLLFPGPAVDPVLGTLLVPPEVENAPDLGRPVLPDPPLMGEEDEPTVVVLDVGLGGMDVACPGFVVPTGWCTGDGDDSAVARPATSTAIAAIISVRRIRRRHGECASGCGPGLAPSVSLAMTGASGTGA